MALRGLVNSSRLDLLLSRVVEKVEENNLELVRVRQELRGKATGAEVAEQQAATADRLAAPEQRCTALERATAVPFTAAAGDGAGDAQAGDAPRAGVSGAGAGGRGPTVAGRTVGEVTAGHARALAGVQHGLARKAGAAAVGGKAFVSKLIAPFLAKVATLTGTGLAAVAGGPLGLAAGVAVDYLLSQGLALVSEASFEQEMRRILHATQQEWLAVVGSELDAAVRELCK